MIYLTKPLLELSILGALSFLTKPMSVMIQKYKMKAYVHVNNKRVSQLKRTFYTFLLVQST